jgi:hypothetical protein
MKLPRIRLRFGMRAMLVLTTIVCVGVAWRVSQYQARKQLIANIRAAGGTFGVAISGPRWLRDQVGDDEYFYEPVRISFGPMTGLPPADGIQLNAVLSGCRSLNRLEVLDLRGSSINDESLAIIAELPTVRILRLSNTKVTDAGLEHLRELPRLEFIWIGGTEITNSAIGRFKAVRPGCKITNDR